MEKSTKSSCDDIAKIGDGENGREDGLETGVITFGRQLIHLEETLVGAALYLDQVWNANSSGNLGKVETAAKGAVLVGHSLLLGTRSAREKRRATVRVMRCSGCWVLPRKVRPASFGTGFPAIVTAAQKTWVQCRFLLARKAVTGLRFRFTWPVSEEILILPARRTGSPAGLKPGRWIAAGRRCGRGKDREAAGKARNARRDNKSRERHNRIVHCIVTECSIPAAAKSEVRAA